jgi:hypothetical protein
MVGPRQPSMSLVAAYAGSLQRSDDRWNDGVEVAEAILYVPEVSSLLPRLATAVVFSGWTRLIGLWCACLLLLQLVHQVQIQLDTNRSTTFKAPFGYSTSHPDRRSWIRVDLIPHKLSLSRNKWGPKHGVNKLTQPTLFYYSHLLAA